MSGRSWTTATLSGLCLVVGAALGGCSEDEVGPGRITVSGAFIACKREACSTLPAWRATVKLVRLSDGDTAELTLERNGMATTSLAPGRYRVLMGYPGLGIRPEPVTTVEMRDGIDRDVAHVFEERLRGTGRRV